MPAISVIVPVYNTQKFIHNCVNSILFQTFRDFELILVDDGSPDNCPAICDECAAKDNRVRVIHQKNQGQAAARNRGAAEALGQWVCFVDSDDLIHPQMLEHLYAAARETGANITACNALEAEELPENFGDNRNPSFTALATEEQGLFAVHAEWGYCYWVVWGKLIRREILLQYPMVEGRIYEDNAVVFRWLYEARTVAYTPSQYYFYRVNPEGTTKNGFSLKHLDWLWALEEQIRFYREKDFRELDRLLTAEFLKHSAWNVGRCLYKLDAPEAAESVREGMKRIAEGRRLKALPLSERERKQIQEAMHPQYCRLLRLPGYCVQILKEQGPAGIARRICRRKKQ